MRIASCCTILPRRRAGCWDGTSSSACGRRAGRPRRWSAMSCWPSGRSERKRPSARRAAPGHRAAPAAGAAGRRFPWHPGPPWAALPPARGACGRGPSAPGATRVSPHCPHHSQEPTMGPLDAYAPRLEQLCQEIAGSNGDFLRPCSDVLKRLEETVAALRADAEKLQEQMKAECLAQAAALRAEGERAQQEQQKRAEEVRAAGASPEEVPFPWEDHQDIEEGAVAELIAGLVQSALPGPNGWNVPAKTG